MEKQRCKSESKSCRRLLTFIFITFICSYNLFAQVLTANEISSLRIKPSVEQDLYTKSDIKFELFIPKVKASQIQFISNSQRSDISFRTMRKTDDYENGGTVIELWYNFEKKGSYTLNPIQLSIQGRRRNIRFEPITVTDDPAKQSPRIVIKFSNGTVVYSDDGIYNSPIFSTPADKKVLLTVYLQYATQLINFTWDIPKDAIFTQTRSYEIMEVKYREKNITHDLIPVASFEWTGLAKGDQILPKMKIIATAYNGSRYELIMPELKATFTTSTENIVLSKEDKLFDNAFVLATLDSDETTNVEITNEICQTLANMYSKERNSLFNAKTLNKNRQEYELMQNLPVNYEKDYSIRIIFGAILLLTGGIILLILSIHDKKPIRIIISLTIMMIAIVACFYGLAKRMETQGICTGCTIYSIPEESAEAKAEMGAGNKVRITEKAGKWYYIELGETGGWCRAENIILIK